MGVILDSSVIVAFERGRFDLPALLRDHSPSAIAVITAAELLIGVERADSPQRRARRDEFVRGIFAELPIISFELGQARVYAAEVADLSRRGQIIGDRDLQIAATAMLLEYDVATLNKREFERLSGLRLVDVSPYAIV